MVNSKFHQFKVNLTGILFKVALKVVYVKMMLKGLKEALTVLIVTHVTHVKGVERSLNSFNCYSCQKGRK